MRDYKVQKKYFSFWQINIMLYIYSEIKNMKLTNAYFYGYYFYFNSESRD